MKPRTLLALVLALGVVAVSCDSGETELSTTTSVVVGTTEPPALATTTSTTVADSTTTTSLVGETVTSHEVAARISTDSGEILHIVIPPGAYTDVDLVNFVVELREGNPDLWGLEVFDDPAGPEAWLTPEDQRTPEQEEILEDHHFLSLSRGDQVAFRGPFSELGEFILAS